MYTNTIMQSRDAFQTHLIPDISQIVRFSNGAGSVYLSIFTASIQAIMIFEKTTRNQTINFLQVLETQKNKIYSRAPAQQQNIDYVMSCISYFLNSTHEFSSRINDLYNTLQSAQALYFEEFIKEILISNSTQSMIDAIQKNSLTKGLILDILETISILFNFHIQFLSDNNTKSIQSEFEGPVIFFYFQGPAQLSVLYSQYTAYLEVNPSEAEQYLEALMKVPINNKTIDLPKYPELDQTTTRQTPENLKYSGFPIYETLNNNFNTERDQIPADIIELISKLSIVIRNNCVYDEGLQKFCTDLLPKYPQLKIMKEAVCSVVNATRPLPAIPRMSHDKRRDKNPVYPHQSQKLNKETNLQAGNKPINSALPGNSPAILPLGNNPAVLPHLGNNFTLPHAKNPAAPSPLQNNMKMPPLLSNNSNTHSPHLNKTEKLCSNHQKYLDTSFFSKDINCPGNDCSICNACRLQNTNNCIGCGRGYSDLEIQLLDIFALG